MTEIRAATEGAVISAFLQAEVDFSFYDGNIQKSIAVLAEGRMVPDRLIHRQHGGLGSSH